MLAAPWLASEKMMRFFAPLLLAAGFAVFAPPAALAQNIVGMFGEDSGALRIQLDSPAPPDGLTATVGLACNAASGVSVGGGVGTEVQNFTVALGADPASADDDDIRACARVWEVTIAARESEAVFAPQIASYAAGRLIEFFLADPGGDEFLIDDSARYIAVVRGLRASFAADNPRVVVEGQNAALTIALSGAVGFPGAAVSVAAGGTADDPADYALDGLSGGRIAVADGASEAAFTVNTATDSESESAGENIVPHETAIFEIADSRGSGFAVGDSGATMTLLIADAGAHSTIAFDPVGADAAEGDLVILSLSFNALPIGFRITLTGADAADNGDWSFVGGGCAEPTTANPNQCVIAIAAGAVAAEVAVAVADDGEAELAEEFGLTLQGDAPPGYVSGGDFMLTIAVSDVNAVDDDGNSALMRAVRAGDADAVEAWIAVGADAALVNNAGKTALDLANALADGRAKAVILALLSALPDVPQGLTAAAAGGGASERVVLAWNPAGRATGYKVYHGLDGATPLTVLADAVAETTWTHEGALPGTHTYEVAAVKAGVSESDRSAQASATVVAGICGRTEEVRNGIIAKIAGVSDCADVTAEHLANFGSNVNNRTLDFDDQEIVTLQPGDFSGLGGLAQLRLNNIGLTSLSMEVFSGLGGLGTLWLEYNELTELPADVFSGLGNLEFLYLGSNNLAELPAAVFSGLGNLKNLGLNSNGLISLPDGVFSGLSNLNILHLNHNNLTSLPEGVLDDLVKLKSLYLQSQFNFALTSLPAGMFSGVGGLLTLRLQDTNQRPSHFHLTVRLARTDAASAAAGPATTVRVELAEGAPFEITVGLSATGGSLSAANAIIPAGALHSGDIVVTYTGEARISIISTPRRPANHTGYGLVADAAPLTFGAPTALLEAAAIGDADAVADALANGADPNEQNINGDTALDLANVLDDGADKTAIIDALIAAGGRCNNTCATDDESEATLRTAAAVGDAATLMTLLARGVNPDAQNADDGNAALHLATAAGNAGIVDALIAVGADLNLQNNADDSALHLATKAGNAGIVDALIAAGADVNLQNNDDDTALHLATEAGNAGIVDALIAAGADASLQNSDGDTALHLAAEAGNAGIVFALIAAGANVKLRNNDNETALDLADALAAGENKEAIIGALAAADSERAAMPRGLTAASAGGGASEDIVLTWNRVHRDDAYNVYHGRNGAELTVRAAAVTEPTWTHRNAVAGTHTYAVVAVRADVSDSARSAEASATVAAGICGRTERVRNIIVQNIEGVTDCADVTAAHLQVIGSEISGLLDFLGDRIPTLQSGDFSGLSSVRNLRLDGNLLESLPVGVFAGLDQLTNLSLSFNQFETLPADVFAELGQLRNLDLSNNQFETLPAGVFAELGRLSNLDLSNNQFETLSADGFAGLGGLGSLNLRSNDLNALPANVFDNLRGLRNLDLRHNPLATLPSDTFAGLGILLTLDLSFTQLTELPPDAFADSDRLRTLWLNDNQLTSLPPDVFAGLSGLRHLLLYENSLAELPAGMLSNLTSLGQGQLELQGNPGSPFNFTVRLTRTDADALAAGPATMRLEITEGAPVTVTVELSATGGVLSAATVTIPPGALHSADFTAEYTEWARISISAVRALLVFPNFQGFQIVAGPAVGLAPTGALRQAAAAGDAAAVRAMLAQGGDPNALADDGTALHLAVTAGDFAIVTALINAGTDVALQNAAGQTALDLARGLDDSVTDKLLISEALGLAGLNAGLERAAVPTGLTASASGVGASEAVILRWNPAAGATGYKVHHGLDGALLTVLATLATETTWTHENASAGTNAYAVAAVNAGVVDSELSAQASVTVTAGICRRTNGVQNGIIAAIDGVSDCAAVTAAHLAGISGTLNLANQGITALQPGDFSGLSGLAALHLHSNQLTSLSAEAFAGLDSLTALHLNQNHLSALPPEVFSGLDSLAELHLNQNRLSALSAEAFAGLGGLAELNLSQNRLSALPPEVFAGLGGLEALILTNNPLPRLPVDVFSGVGNLRALLLGFNHLTSLPAGVFSGVGGLVTLQLQGNPVSPFNLIVRLARTDADALAAGRVTVRAELAEGAPFEIAVGLSAPGGELSAANAIIPAGALHSGDIVVTYTAEARISISTLDALPENHQGYRLAAAAPLTFGAPTALLEAAAAGDADAVAVALAAGADPNAQNGDGDTALHLAAAAGNAGIVDALIAAGANLSLQNGDGDTALHLAAAGGNAGIVDALIAAGADISLQNNAGDTALMLAVRAGHTAVMTALLVSVNIQNNDGDTALIVAVKSDANTNVRTAMVTGLLAARGVLVNLQDGDGNTALDWANKKNDSAIRPLLLAAGARCNRDCRGDDTGVDGVERGTTALHTAAEAGDAAEVAALLTAGEININAQTAHIVGVRPVGDAGNTALMLAARGGHTAVVTALLGEAGIGVNIQNDGGDTALMLAARGGHTDAVTALRGADGIEVNIQNDAGDTALIAAARNGHTAVVMALRGAAGDGVNIQNDAGDTALIAAARNGHADAVARLIALNRVDRNAKNSAGDTALIVAARNGHADAVARLIANNGVDLNVQNNAFDTALIAAVRGDHTAVAEDLISTPGLSLSLQNNAGDTALIVAAADGDAAVVTAMFARVGDSSEDISANINTQNNAGDTALMRAVSGNHADVVEDLLARAEIAVNLINNDDYTALDVANVRNREDLRTLLLAKGAACNRECRDGDTDTNGVVRGGAQVADALHAAAAAGDAAEVAALLASGVIGVNAPNAAGETALMLAVAGGRDAIVEQLIAAGAEVNLQDRNGKTALMLAVAGGRLAVVEQLIAAGAEVNLQDHNGETALIAAAGSGRDAVVGRLLAAGAKVNLQDRNGKTALIAAAGSGHADVVTRLLLAPGILPNLQNDIGQTALILAISSGYFDDNDNYDDVAEILAHHPGIAVNLQTQTGHTALDWANFYWRLAFQNRENVRAVRVRLFALGAVCNQDCISNAPAIPGETNALHTAAADGDTDGVTDLLTAGEIDINALNADGETALMLAAAGGHDAVVEQLIAKGAEVNLQGRKQDRNGQTALLTAAQNGHGAVVDRLLQASGIHDVNFRNAAGETALMLAAENGHADVVERLLGRDDIAVNLLSGDDYTALDFANIRNRENIRNLLLAKGAGCRSECSGDDPDVSAVASPPADALRVAAADGDAAEVAALLASGVIGVNAPNAAGETALMLAAENGHADVVTRLLDAPGIAVDAQNEDGRTALMIAAGSIAAGSRLAIVELLADAGADVNRQDRNGQTALLAAAGSGYVAVVERLLQASGILVNIKNILGDTALLSATKSGRTAVVAKLIAHQGIEINAQDNDRNTALMPAALNNDHEIVTLLLAAPGIAVNLGNKDGRTALMQAARWNSVEAIEKLIAARGILINAQDNAGYTALDWANERKQEDARNSLLTAGARCSEECRDGDTRLGETAQGASAQGASAVQGESAVRTGRAVGVARSSVAGDLGAQGGKTALMRAASFGYGYVVKKLLAAGVAINAQDASGRTALDYANAGNREDIRALLLAAGARCSAACRAGDARLAETAAR